MNKRELARSAYMSTRKFKQGAIEDLRVKGIREEIVKESRAKLLDKTKQQKEEAWIVLAHQVIGRERL